MDSRIKEAQPKYKHGDHVLVLNDCGEYEEAWIDVICPHYEYSISLKPDKWYKGNTLNGVRKEERHIKPYPTEESRLTAETEPCEGHDGINNYLHCGGRAEIVHGMQDGWIACSKCGAAGPRRSSDEDAIAAWNRAYARQYAAKQTEELREAAKLCAIELRALRNQVGLKIVWNEGASLDRALKSAEKALSATEPKESAQSAKES